MNTYIFGLGLFVVFGTLGLNLARKYVFVKVTYQEFFIMIVSLLLAIVGLSIIL